MYVKVKKIRSTCDVKFEKKISFHSLKQVLTILVFLLQDNGKPIWEARMDMETVIGAFEYFGGIAPSIMGETYFSTINSMHNYSCRNK